MTLETLEKIDRVINRSFQVLGIGVFQILGIVLLVVAGTSKEYVNVYLGIGSLFIVLALVCLVGLIQKICQENLKGVGK